MHLEKFSLNFSSWSFAIRVNLRHPYPSSFVFGLFLPLWHLNTLANDYFKVLFYLKAILHDAKNDSKYRDVAPLMTELRKLEVDPALIGWIPAFLATLSDWKFLKGGVPQGTKLGVILFTIMTKNLLANWHLRVKFVDDTSAIEILPRSSISLLNSIVSDIHKFSMDHNTRLNPIKCKEMLINFMLYPNFTLRPFKLLGTSV